METEIPFDVIEAMLAAMNKALYSGRTTHQILQAGIGAANGLGWVLKHDPRGSNKGMVVPQESGSEKRHVLVALDDLTDDLGRSRK